MTLLREETEHRYPPQPSTAFSITSNKVNSIQIPKQKHILVWHYFSSQKICTTTYNTSSKDYYNCHFFPLFDINTKFHFIHIYDVINLNIFCSESETSSWQRPLFPSNYQRCVDLFKIVFVIISVIFGTVMAPWTCSALEWCIYFAYQLYMLTILLNFERLSFN